MPTRRQFIASVAALAAAAGFPRRSWAAMLEPSSDYPVQPVPGGGFVFLGEGGAVLALPTKTAPVIVDAKFAQTADDLARQVTRKMTAMPELLINTHHHYDHTGGNWTFSPTAEIVAHKNLKPRLAANLPIYREHTQNAVKVLREAGAAPEVVAQAVTIAGHVQKLTVENFAAKREFEKDLTITHDGLEIQLHHFGPGHTDNDAVVFFPALNILHVGDLVFNRWHPYIDRPAGATTVGWQQSLRESFKLCNEQTVVIGGHGAVDTRAAISRQIEYFDAVRALVGKAIKAGKSRDQVGAMDDEAFKDFTDVRLRAMALQAVHDELSNSKS